MKIGANHQPHLAPPSQNEAKQAKKLLTLLENSGAGKSSVVGNEGTAVPLRGTVYEAFVRVLRELAMGKAVSIEAFNSDLTVEEAARLLYAPVPALNQMLDRGELPSRMDDSIRLVPLKALLAYKERESRRRRKILTWLTQESQKMGLYDDDAP